MKKTLIILSLAVITNLYCDEQLSTYDAVNKLNDATSLLIKKYNQSEEKIKLLENKVNALTKEVEELKNLQNQIVTPNTETEHVISSNTVTNIDGNKLSSIDILYQVTVTTWIANIRNTPYLNEKNIVKRTDIGTKLNVVKIVNDFYQLDTGDYIHTSVVDVNKSITKIVKNRKIYSKVLENESLRNFTVYKKGDVLNVIGFDKNKKWLILEDGSLINHLDVE